MVGSCEEHLVLTMQYQHSSSKFNLYLIGFNSVKSSLIFNFFHCSKEY